METKNEIKAMLAGAIALIQGQTLNVHTPYGNLIVERSALTNRYGARWEPAACQSKYPYMYVHMADIACDITEWLIRVYGHDTLFDAVNAANQC